MEQAARPERQDVALAAGLGTVSLLQVLLDPIAGPVASVVVALSSTLPLAWRHRRPVVAALAGSVVWLVPTEGFLYLGFVVAALLYYCVGSEVSGSRRVAVVAAIGALIAVVATLRSAQPPPTAFGSALAVLGPTVAGRLVAHQRSQNLRLRELTAQLVEERATAERAAVAEERARIARELHDVIGHDVTVIALQADAAAAALAHAPQRAAAPVAAIRAAAAEALREMRSVVGVLSSMDEPGLRPQPGLRDLPTLVERCRAAGVPVSLELDPPARRMTSSTELAAYRTVQEALTNVQRYAAGAQVHVQVRGEHDELVVEVVDGGGRPGPCAGGGTGLIGLGERVRVLGGQLRAGPRAEGGFAVSARLPLVPVGEA